MFSLKVDNEISLALVQPSFAPEIYRVVSAQVEYLSQWLAWPQNAYGEEFFLSFIKSSLQDYAEGKSLTCSVFYQNELVGNISFNAIHRSLKKAEIGYWLSHDWQGKGIMTRAVEKMIALAFEQYGLEKVEIHAAERNQPSRALCERLGFTLEGVITNAENLNGRIVNHAVYGLFKNN